MTGSIQGKEKFLQNIADRFGREEPITSGVEVPEWQNRPQDAVYAGLNQAQLQEKLIEHCDVIHTTVETTTKAELADVVERAFADYGTAPVVYWDDPRMEHFGLADRLASRPDTHRWDENDPDLAVAQAADAKIGLTFSDVTLAESGTLVLFSGPGKGRAVSLLPEGHIALIPRSTIVPRMTQAASIIHERQQEDGIVPSCINFISGPSNSADIEMRLLVGVHGPVRAHYIIIEDA
ncbi:LutC/YkgG family protein [Alkalicoccus chagannorensis]|uniref:LutC/YkgG family protein n=1 Tax=Alkalicoccus chagannorensis TaxID=427072 RepID=UPI000408E086|nr:lactate utilization protein C [Alkalicoccus chagannorensis]